MILGFFSDQNLNFRIDEEQRYTEICKLLDSNSKKSNGRPNENGVLTWDQKAKSVLLYGIEEQKITDELGKDITIEDQIHEIGWSLLYLQGEESPLLKRKENLAPKTATFLTQPQNEEGEKTPENDQPPQIHKHHERKTSSNAIFKKMGTLFNCINKNSNADSPESENNSELSHQEKVSEAPLKIDSRIHRMINLSKPPYFAPHINPISNYHSRTLSDSENEMPRLTTLQYIPRSNNHSRSPSISENEGPRLQPSQPNIIPHDLHLQSNHSRNHSNSDAQHLVSSQPIPISFNPRRLKPYELISAESTPNPSKSLIPVAPMLSESKANIRVPERHLPPLHSEPKFKNSKKLKIVVVDYSHKFLIKFPPKHILFPLNLHTLNLSHNQLSIIPEIVYHLNITTLLISHNKIKEIGDKINKLQTLERLDISYNDLRKISSNITKLSNLKFLSVENNQLLELPKQMGSLMKLEELNISLNAIQDLPNQLLWLKRLRVFKVTKSYLSESAILIAKGLKREGNRINDAKSH